MINKETLLDPMAKEELRKKDRECLWHQMSVYHPSSSPTIFAEGEGAWLTDIDGNRYLDAMSGLWCVNVGYHQPLLALAAANQMNTLPFYPLTQSHIPAIKLAEKLNEWLGGDYYIFFSNSGSEANEVAFKLARQYFKQIGEGERYKFISRYRAYHGNSMGALSATGQADRKYKFEPLVEGFKHVSPPDCYRCPYGKTEDSCSLECAEEIGRAIQMEGGRTVAGVIMEPAITGGGIIVPPLEYVQRVAEICKNAGVLLIMDEVICGFGRSGEHFGHQNYGVQPDIVTMAKGITSGYLPLSATAVKKDIFDAFKGTGAHDHFRHVNTFGGNPVACAVALKNLEIIEENNLLARVKELSEKLASRLKPLKEHPNVGDLRQFGFLFGIELVESKDTKEPLAPAKMGRIMAECKQNGLIIGRNGDTAPGLNNVLTLCPPFIIKDEEVDYISDKLTQAIYSITNS